MQSNGIKTTEFWMVGASAGLMVLNAGLGLKLSSNQIIGFFGAVISYVGGRTWLKTKG